MSLISEWKGLIRVRRRETALEKWRKLSPADQKAILLDEFSTCAQQLKYVDLNNMTSFQRRVAKDYVKIVDALAKHGYQIAYSGVERVLEALGGEANAGHRE